MAEKQTAREDRSTDSGESPRTVAANRTVALHICPRCESELVYPIDWAPAEEEGWNVGLRCPDCEWTGGGLYTQDVVDRLDRALDAGTQRLLRDLNLLARANVEEQIRCFAAALEANHILPEDF
ncbi:MAG: hypothetical protein ACRDLO_09695 [Solirubrobacterales bacterium]